MTKGLPAHLRGWRIPAIDGDPAFTVMRVGTSNGPIYQAGTLKENWSQHDPKDTMMWVVDGDDRRGMAILQFEVYGHAARSHRGFRATAAMLHFCVQAETLPDGTGYLPEDGVLYVPRSEVERSSPRDMSYLRSLGFAAVYETDDLVADPARLRATTAFHCPEFAQATELPHIDEAAAAASLAQERQAALE